MRPPLATTQWAPTLRIDVAGYVLDPGTIFTDVAAGSAGSG